MVINTKIIQNMEGLIIHNLSGLCRNEELLYGAHFDLLEDEASLSKYHEDELSEDHPLLKNFIIKKMQLDREARFFIFDHHRFELNPQPLDLCHTVKKDLNQITPIMYKIDLNNYHLYFAREDELIIHKNINNWPIYNDLLEKTEENFNMLMDLYLGPFDRFKSISELCLRILRKNTKKPLLEKIQTLHDFYFKE